MHRTVWVLFWVALLLRLGLVAHHAAIGWQLRYDPAMYLALADNLRHGVYSMFHPLDIPDTVKRPGYPVLLHLLQGNIAVVLILQTALSALKIPLVYLLAGRLGAGVSVAFTAALLMALEPMDILLAGQVLSESLFATLVLAGVWMATYRPWRNMAFAALLLAAAAWVRPNGAGIILVTSLVVILPLHRSPARALACAALAFLLLAPWAFWNQRVLGRFYLGDSAVVAAAYYQVPAVLREAGDERASDWRSSLEARASATDWEDRAQFHAFFDGRRQEVRAIFQQYPLTWLQVQGAKALRILFAPGSGHVRTFFNAQGWAGCVLWAWSVAYSAALLVALPLLVIRWRVVPRAFGPLLLLSLYFIASGALTTPDARFKNPAMPFLLVMVAWVMLRILPPLLSRLRRPVGRPLPST